MYIDPGSTNFIIQILIGAAAGAGLAIATFWRRIRMFFSRDKGRDKATGKEGGASPSAQAQPPTAPAEVPTTPPPAETPPVQAPPAPPAAGPGSASTQE